MGILHSPDDAIRLEVDGITYIIRTPRFHDNSTLLSKVRERGGRDVTEAELIACMERGVRELFSAKEDEAERQKYLGEIATHKIKQQQFFNILAEHPDVDDEEDLSWFEEAREQAAASSGMLELEMLMEDRYPPYNALVARKVRFPALYAEVAAKMFLVGWEGTEAPFRRQYNEVHEYTLSLIPVHHLERIAIKVKELLNPSRRSLKNWQSVSGGHSDQAPSPSTAHEKRQSNGRSKSATGPTTQ